ncbi:MAG TPA: hypothetical protein VFE46_07375 [Pirellulales bacterium]|jgi:hypothetical protein|nr:hypothetical protein [Pirellulales bacterium]
MLKIRNICGLTAAALVLLAGLANVSAAQSTPVKNASLNSSGDCCQTAPTPAPACTTYKPCITYRGCCDCCGPKVSQVLKVKDPGDCCCNSLAEIPVCLPACCKNPCVSCKCGLLGRGVVTYSYDCCCVTVIFTRCGDVIVRYS